MSGIIEKVQKNLGLPSLKKVDPNIQEVKGGEQHASDKLSQAAVPAVLAGLFKKTRTERGTMEMLNGERRGDCVSEIFGNQGDEAVSKVATYAGVEDDRARATMNEVATEALSVIREEAGDKASYEKVEHYMNGQRHQILVHLPAALQLGQLLDDDTMDDRTNKMEGPVSTFMNKLGDTLADGESKQGTF